RGGEVGVRKAPEFLNLGEERVARGQNGRARDILAVLVAAALPRPREPAVAREIDEARLPAVEVTASERLFQPDLTTEPPDGVRIDVQIIALGCARGGQIGELMKVRDETIYLRWSIERGPVPRMWKI